MTTLTHTVAAPPPAEAAEREDLAAWLLHEGPKFRRTRKLIGALCHKLIAADVPIMRAAVTVRTLHPQILGTGYTWAPGMHDAVQVDRGHDILNDEMYLRSPFKTIHDGAPRVRRRLEGPDTQLDYPILEELRAKGGTDYVALPLNFGDGSIHVISLATDRPGGFTKGCIALFETLLPALSTVLELLNQRRVTAALLETYLGLNAGKRVLNGEITRGSGENIHAVVWYSDLRGFTPLSDSKPRDELMSVLNDYFEIMIGEIEAGGGEVLKLVGDAVLAIFPMTDAAFRYYICNKALDTAVKARAAMMERNIQRAAEGKVATGFGIALHLGDVIYGNIGAPDRLDFTVVGPAVNHVTRIEELCKQVGTNLLVSEAFKSTCERKLVSVGEHRLRGIDEPQEIFTVPEKAR